MPKIVCIIQARMGSTRLPGKVLKLLQGKPLLWWDMYRIKQSRFVDEIVIATTTQPQDDPLAAPGETEGWQVFRGSEDDVLDRYYQAAERYRADIVVRITSDCPLIDPTMIDYTITAFLSAAPSVDYAANILVRRYPRGLDVEVFSAEALGPGVARGSLGMARACDPLHLQQSECISPAGGSESRRLFSASLDGRYAGRF